MPRVLRWVGLVMVLSLLGAGSVWWAGTGADRQVRAPLGEDRSARAVLDAWDRSRAQAWAEGDVAGLGRLYVAGSSAGRRDTRHLRAWTRRGWVVRGIGRQITSLSVEQVDGSRVRVRVTERLAGAVAHRRGAPPDDPGRQLPAGADRARVVEFRQVEGRWQLALAHAVE